MQDALNRVLIGLAAIGVSVDIVWIASGHFRIEGGAYIVLAIMVALCTVAAFYYGRSRNEPALSAMFSATAFLMAFPAAICLFTYLALTIAGPRIDIPLAAIDRSLGISWPAIMAFAGDHPLMTRVLEIAYQSIVVQTLLLVLLLGWRQQLMQLYGFCLAIALGAIVTVAIWTAFPAFGAYSVYPLSSAVAGKLHLVEGVDYGRQLTLLLKNGPGLISATDLRGLIGFPSYHTVQAIVLAWYTRNVPYWRWPSFALNLLMIAATPVHGGHHVVDIFGGIVVAIAAILAADLLVRRLYQADGFSSVPAVSTEAQSAAA